MFYFVVLVLASKKSLMRSIVIFVNNKDVFKNDLLLHLTHSSERFKKPR